MRLAVRVSSAAVALAIAMAAPALAQEATPPASGQPETAAPAPPSEGAIGPAQLRDFSINGTVTRRVETPAASTPQPAPAETVAATAPAPAPERAQPAQAAGSELTREAANARAPGAERAGRAQAAASASLGALDFPPPTPTGRQPGFSQTTFTPPAATPIVDTVSTDQASFISNWPWLLALLAALGAAVWYFRRQRPGSYAFAGAGADAAAFDFSPPEPSAAPPSPPRAAPTPQPAPPPSLPGAAPGPATAPVGIVSTRLRPWLEIEFSPEAAIIDDEKAAVQFEVTVYNSGSAPARDVRIEAALFNAGPDQDQAIGQFFMRPSAQGDGISVPPLQRMSFRSLVNMPRDQLRLFEVEGRTLFVPIIAFNALYRWSSGEGQTSASFIVGRDTHGERMAPFRVEAGSRTFRGLGGREHSLRVRK